MSLPALRFRIVTDGWCQMRDECHSDSSPGHRVVQQIVAIIEETLQISSIFVGIYHEFRHQALLHDKEAGLKRTATRAIAATANLVRLFFGW